MTLTNSRLLITIVGVIFILTWKTSAAQEHPSQEEGTWLDSLQTQSSRLEPQNLELLSIQVSTLPRDTFGHGKPPFGSGFVTSFLAASGTGILGLFELDHDAELKYREEASSLTLFVDDSGNDLTKNPAEKEINKFFEENKPLSVELSPNHSHAQFTVRGYSTPVKGARSVKAEAEIVFLAFSREKSETQEIDGFASCQQVQIGPLEFSIHKAGKSTLFPSAGTTRTVNQSFGDGKREWVLQIEPRLKPMKHMELLDSEGAVIKTIQGMMFDGKNHRYYLEKLDATPKSVRVTWYERWERITVPLKIETPLGI